MWRSLGESRYLYWRRQWHPTPVFLPGESHGWRSRVGCSPWGLHRVGHDWSNLAAAEGNGTPLQYSCLGNPMDGGAWWAAVDGVAKSQTRLSDFTFTFHFPALEKKMATTPVFMPRESQGWGSLVAAVYGVTQSQTRLKRLSSSSSLF